MDNMLPYELADILDNLKYVDRNSWEQTRIVAYYIAQKMCKKKLELTEILPLPFDDEKEYDQELNMEEINNQAKALENFLNKR